MAESWARKQKRLALEKLGNKCAACGETRTGVLQFDHIKPIRRKKVGGIMERGPSTVQTSRRIVLDPHPEKTWQILCANCHQIKTNIERAHGWGDDFKDEDSDA